MTFQYHSPGTTIDSNINLPQGGSQAVPAGQQAGGGPFDPDPAKRAQWLYDNINSHISMPQWQAWANLADPKCPPGRPFRTMKQVSGGDQNECVETPDNCPEGTSAFGANQCISVQDPRIGGAAGANGQPGQPGGPQGQQPGIGLADLIGNMTYRSMFRNTTPQQAAGISQVGNQNLFNLGDGQQGRVLSGGAFMWGDPNGFQSGGGQPAAPAANFDKALGGAPAQVQPRQDQPNMFGMVNSMVRRRPNVPSIPQTLRY